MITTNSVKLNCPEILSGSGLRTVVYPAAQWSRVAETWSKLVQGTAQSSFFLSSDWIETWLQVFGSGPDVSVVLFKNADEPVAACLLTSSRTKYGPIRVKRVSLNASGESSSDTTYIEFNSLLCLSGWEQQVADRLAEYVSSLEWDEFALDGFLPGPAYEALLRAFVQFELEEVRRPSYYVDLAALRRAGSSYEGMLKSNRRRVVRQNVQSYTEAAGRLRLAPARNVEDALQMFDELARLNRRRFAAGRGRSIFESAAFLKFHRILIRRCFPRGSVQLLRLAAADRTIGLLYNLVAAGKVYYYQCGFDYEFNPRLSPGIVTLTFGVQHYLDLGYDDFDFLSGEASYKRTLSNGSRDLVWGVFRRPSLKVRLLGAARAGKRRLSQLLTLKA